MNELTELAGSLIRKNGEILLIYRKDEEQWEVPGGKVEEDESPTEAAVREAKEETGIEIELDKPFYSGEFQKDGEIFLWHCYLARLTQGNPEPSEDIIEKVEWFDPSDLSDLELAPNLVQILPAVRNL